MISDPNKSPLVGSMHKYSDGYGYGQRYPTSRNEPTFPSSVPSLRYEPLTERYLKNTTSCIQIKKDLKSDKRNADQILFTTSGEVGKFYIDSESKALKLNKLNNKFTKSTEPKAFSENTKIKDLSNIKLGNLSNSLLTERSIGSAYMIERQRTFIGESPPLSSAPYPYPSLDRRNNGVYISNTSSSSNTPRIINNNKQQHQGQVERSNTNNNTSLSSSPFLSTIKELDKSFPKVIRRDLFAATLPRSSEQEQRWTAASNDRCAQSSKLWSLKLRKDSN